MISQTKILLVYQPACFNMISHTEILVVYKLACDMFSKTQIQVAYQLACANNDLLDRDTSSVPTRLWQL